MAYRIIYTSAPRLLQAGRSGFGVVACHKEIPQDIVEFSERISQFSRAAGFPVDRVVYAYRVFRAPSGNWHIMSRISDAGASFTGRTNHLAEHLVVDQVEVQKIITAGGTPAGVMLAYAWPAFSGDSRWLSSTEAWEATAVRANPYGDKWAELCPDGDAKRRRLLSCSPGVTPQILFEYPDRLRTSAGAKEILHLFAESESDCPKRGWGCAFTTDLQPSDNQTDFQWIGLPLSSPLGAALKSSGRKLVDFRSPVPKSSVTKPSAAAGKIGQKQPTVRKVRSRDPAPRKRVARSSWPIWLKVLLGCLGVLVLAAALMLIFVATKLSPQAASSQVAGSKAPQPQVDPSSGAADHFTLPEVVPTPSPPPLPRRFEKTFLVRYVENQRPGKLSSDEKNSFNTVKAADTQVEELFKNSNSSPLHVQYLAWQSDFHDPQEMGPVGSHKLYDAVLTKRGEAGRPPSQPLDLTFGLADSSQPRPLRIIELEPQRGTPSTRFPLPDAEFVVEAAQEEESVNFLDVKSNPDIAGLRVRTDEALVLRPERALLAKIAVESIAEDVDRDFALLAIPDEALSLPTLKVENVQWIRAKRNALKDKADGKFPPSESKFKGVVAFLEAWQSGDNNSKPLLNALLEHFGEQPTPDSSKPSSANAEHDVSPNDSGDKSAQSASKRPEDPNPIFLDADTKLSNSRRPGAEQTRRILSRNKTLDASELKERLLGELQELLRKETENQQEQLKKRQRQAQETLNELFGHGNSLLPAGDYILGLKSEENFYPAMKVRISFGSSVEAQKRAPEGRKSLSRPGADPANAMNSIP